LRDSRLDYAIVNKLPKRYKRIIEEIGAHSDDEYDEKKKVYVIKTLKFRSRKANIFFRRLDEAMVQAERNEGSITRKRTRCLPKIPIESTIVKPPKGLPIDFYSIKWFKKLEHSQKEAMADCNNVAFLLTPEECLKPKRHPDEKISDKNFSKKYRDIVVEPYELQEFESDESAKEESKGESIDLEGPSPDCSEEEDDGLYAPGEYSYEDDEFIHKGESSVSDDESSGESEPEEAEGMEGIEV
ncbi:hypothetical protein O181_075322, partial [Austropuccinia psidii MF-1]|nr:hypothetical protein [Austropuccinia psidii MF-1]